MSQTMEALRLSSMAQPHLPLLRRRHHHHHHTTLHSNPRFNPFITAALSKPAETISSPLLSSVESPVVIPPLKVSSNSLQYPPGYLGAVPDRSHSDDGAVVVSPMNYLTNILTSKVYDVAKETPLELAPKLSERIGVNIWLKREDLQPVFSFKLRGAYNMMAKLPPEVLEKGVICSSAGNHAQGVALAAKRLNCSAVIAMPVTTPDIKWKSVERLGATVVLIGDSYDEAQAYAKKRGIDDGRTFIPPFDHPDIIMGQGTVGMEIVRQMKGPVHAIFVPVGGGGLIAGIAAYVKRINPEVKIIGVEPTDANAMALSLHHGHRVMLDQVGGFADGVAVKEVGEETFRLCKELVDGVVLVSRDAICASIKDMFEENRSILEPAGALALAGAEAYCKYYGLKGENVIAIASGANMNFDKLRIVTELANVGRKQKATSIINTCNARDMFEEKRSILEPAGALALAGAEAYCKYYGLKGENVIAITSGANMNFDKLRIVTELANVGRKQEAILQTILPEEPGSFKRFCELVGQMNITEFKYRYNSSEEAVVLYSVGVHTPSELKQMQERMESSQLETHDLSDMDLVKDHFRHLMGGRPNIQNEVLCRFTFPERPGALMKFLDSFSPRWNISLFHYRAQGETGANVLVGIQVPSNEMDEFHDRANRLGYEYDVVVKTVATQRLLKLF